MAATASVIPAEAGESLRVGGHPGLIREFSISLGHSDHPGKKAEGKTAHRKTGKWS